MPIYTITLLKRRMVAKDTLELVFERPTGFDFVPGQYGGFTLINAKGLGPQEATRRFSILSAPDEPHLAIVTRLQPSRYKQALNALAPGDTIKLAGPMGAFVLHDDFTVPAALIAGGIGVAPFCSMIHYASRHQATRWIYLFYGNQHLADAAYFDEMMALSTTYDSLTFVPTLAFPPTGWQGEQGNISAEILKKHIINIELPIYYICGSPAMVTALQETLIEMGVLEGKIKVEDFPGY